MDLLDLIAANEDPDAGRRTHRLLPNTALACGRDTLTVLRSPADAMPAGHRVITTITARTTCPDCLAAGDLDAISAGMQRRQAQPIGDDR
jgi:hypothetical protein